MPIFKGAGVAIVTPFTQDDKVNFEELGKMIDFQIAGGTDAIIICGTTGESSTLTHEEHDECIKFAVEHTAGRVPVIAVQDQTPQQRQFVCPHMHRITVQMRCFL